MKGNIITRTLRRVALAAAASLSALSAQAGTEGWFTVVLFGDPEISMTDRDDNNATRDNIAKWIDCIINMHVEGKGKGVFKFKSQPEGFVPRADLVICMGDMDRDSQVGRGEIEDQFDKIYKAGIPFITMIGNHDVVPDYWNGGDKGVTWGSAGGSAANDHAFDMVRWYRNYASNNNLISDLRVFKNPSGGKQAEPFTFMFRGVRFYIGQTYWFQKTYDAPATIFNSATYYAPNGIISDLTTFVEQNASTPSVWVQHYPINAADRWWNDTNANGATMAPKNTPDYATAAAKREKYKALIAKTTNPYHFSGHQHTSYTVNYTTGGKTFTDYTAPYFATKGGAYIALCKEGVGVVEVKQVIFDMDDPENQVDAKVINEFGELSNDKVYTIRTSSRGNLLYNGSEGYVRASASIAYNSKDNKQLWAIVKNGTRRYLYNVAARKYAQLEGDQLVLTETPGTAAAVTLTKRGTKDGYPWVLKFGSLYLNLSSGYDRGLVVSSWSTLDDGNQFAITEVGDFDELYRALKLLGVEMEPTLSADKLYTLHTPRGYMPVGDEPESMAVLEGGRYLVGTDNRALAGRFRITGSSGKYQIYNVDAKKYLSADGTPQTPYVDRADGTFSFVSVANEELTLAGGATRHKNAWIIKSNVTGKWLMLAGSNQYLNNDGWTLVDDGDQWTIEEACLVGDVNGDQKVNLIDLTLLIGHIIGEANKSFVEEAADVNGDGTVNRDDVVALVAKLLRW